MPDARTPSPGRGEKGSQLRMREWVNKRRDGLNASLAGWSSLAAFLGGSPEWLSPLEPEYEELRDDLWEKAGLAGDSPHKAGWWPKGGPVWDAVAVLPGRAGERGVLLVEAKSHTAELASRAAGNEAAMETIQSALDETKRYLRVPEENDWTTGYYQVANRLAFLYYLRQRRRIPAWLLLVYFLGDRFDSGGRSVVGPTSEADWQPTIDRAYQSLGLSDGHVLSPYVRTVFLPVTP